MSNNSSGMPAQKPKWTFGLCLIAVLLACDVDLPDLILSFFHAAGLSVRQLRLPWINTWGVNSIRETQRVLQAHRSIILYSVRACRKVRYVFVFHVRWLLLSARVAVQSHYPHFQRRTQLLSVGSSFCYTCIPACCFTLLKCLLSASTSAQLQIRFGWRSGSVLAPLDVLVHLCLVAGSG